MRTVLFLFTLATLLLVHATGYSATYYVPDDFQTIQEAVSSALVDSGDVIELTDGVFMGAGNRNLDLQGKAIPIRSRSMNPDSCIIDCGGAGRGFVFTSGERAETIIEGITIRNGSSGEGGGVYCTYGSSPSFTFCIFRDNTSTLMYV